MSRFRAHLTRLARPDATVGASPDRHPNPRKSSQDSLRARATPGLAHGPTGHTPRSRWALSLRARLVGAATVAIVLAIALLGGAVSVLLDRELRSALDDTLRQRVWTPPA